MSSGLAPRHRLALALTVEVAFNLWTWSTRHAPLGTLAGIAPATFFALPCFKYETLRCEALPVACTLPGMVPYGSFMKAILVIGGGSSGVELARALDDAGLDVTLVTRNPTFFWAIGALRAAVEPAWVRRLFIPYDTLMRRGRVVTGTVTALTDTQALLDDGTVLAFDTAVIATGSAVPFPAWPRAGRVAEAEAEYATLADRIATAGHVAVIGGGPVGIELAGEITGAHPGKAVTLVESSPTLIGRYTSPRFGASLQRKLVRLGVTVLTGVSVVSALDEAPVRLADGRVIGADVVLDATGGRPNTGFLRPGLGDDLDAAGRVIVDATMQVRGHPSLYAMGDVVANDEPKTAIVAVAHAKVVARNILARSRGELPKAMHRAKPRAMMLVPLGKTGGAAHLPFLGGIVLGDFAGRMKGKDLFVPRAWAKLRAVMPDTGSIGP